MFEKIKDLWEMPMFAKIAVVVSFLVVIILIFLFLVKGDSAYEGIPLTKDYDQYQAKQVGGREVVKVIQGAFTETPIVVNNKITGSIQSYGPIVMVKDTTIGDYCGYPSILGESDKDGYNDNIGYILNTSNSEYVSKEMNYQSYHVCNESGTQIAVYFEQLGGR